MLSVPGTIARRRIARFLITAVLAALAANAQVDTGSISGTVTDASGAIVPGVQVTVTQIDTNTRVTLPTNASGLYFAAALRPGAYRVSVTKEGFRSETRTGIDLRVQDRLEVNFQLQIGNTTSDITITAAAPILESETSSLGQVIQEKTIRDLPLNGRNFIQLATLTAGTLPSSRTAERDNFISNGARAVQNSYLLDGVDNKNRIVGYDKSSAQIVQPIIDSIEEFKVQTSTFSAEFGQSAGGVVNVTIKSGTNKLHGDLFEFLRNSDLDANPYFQPAAGGKALLIQNQFGATLGGPVIHDKTFFFGAWQTSREVNGAPQVSTVPTLAQRDGVFTGKVTDPQTRIAFPNNTIPRSLWDPVGAKFFALYPAPNLPGTIRNFFYNPRERVNSDQYTFRADHHLGSKDFIFGRISQSWGQNAIPTVLPTPANQAASVDLKSRQIAISETHTFSANFLNEFRLGFAFTENTQDTLGPRLFDQFGINGALNEPKIKGLPAFTITGYAGLGTINPGAVPIAATGSSNSPSDKSGKVWQILDNFSWQRGRHAIKFGIDLSRVTLFSYATNTARPTFSFNGTYTGNAIGDLLLGQVYSAGTSQQQLDTLLQHVYAGYAQDDWKISSKLNLNIGVRYELPKPFTEEYGRQANYLLEPGPCYRTLVTAAAAGSCGLNSALVHTDYNNLAPRLGLAYAITKNAVVRSGFGVFYGRDENVGIARRLVNNPPFVTSATFTGSQTAPAFPLSVGFPANALTLAGGASDVNYFPTDYPLPYVEQWNINVEHQFGGNLLAQIGYTGSEAHKLPLVVNLNQASPGTTSVNSRRPYQGIANINAFAPWDNSTYNALLAKLERRFARGASFLASYTYGHSIDGGGGVNDVADPAPQDPRNLAAHKGNSNFDVKHRFVFSGLYQLPFGKSPGIFAHVIRDWQLSGIFSAQTGQPFTVTLSTDPSGTGTTARPNRIANGNLPSDLRNPSHWFDLTAFAVPNCVCYGNSGRDILRGPGQITLDLGIDRDFRFRERMRLQFRAEAFNLPNHPNFGLPNTAIGNAQAGVISSVVTPERQIQVALKLYF